MRFILQLTFLFLYTEPLSSQTLSWSPVENSDGFRINYDIIESVEDCTPSESLPYSVDVGSATSYDLYSDQNFQDALAYKFQVSAYRGVLSGKLSEHSECILMGTDLDVRNVILKKKSN